MALETSENEVQAEITKVQFQINMGEGKIKKAFNTLEILKTKQQELVTKQKQLQAAKVNIVKFNKTG